MLLDAGNDTSDVYFQSSIELHGAVPLVIMGASNNGPVTHRGVTELSKVVSKAMAQPVALSRIGNIALARAKANQPPEGAERKSE